MLANHLDRRRRAAGAAAALAMAHTADEAVLEVTRCMRDRGLDVPDIGLTADGQLIPGYVPPEQLRARLDRMTEAAAE